MLSMVIIELFLFLFGYIDSNSIISILLGSGSWKDVLSIDNLINSGNLILGATSVVGIYLKNSFLIFAPLAVFLLDFVFGMSGIIGVFPEPIGHILFGIISFMFAWFAVEWWRMRDD